MNDSSGHDAQLTSEEVALAEQLEADRPVPAAGFRGALGRHITSEDPGFGPRPRRLVLIVSGYVASGALLLTLGLLQAEGAL
jgi:hypothetical protein